MASTGKAPRRTQRTRHVPYNEGKGKVPHRAHGAQAGHEEKLKVPRRPDQAGQVLVLGQGMCGQLGLGENITQRTRPALVPLAEGIVQVAAGGVHTVCLSAAGSVYTFGCNDEGALGRATPDAAQESRPGKVVLDEKVVQVSAGNCHTAALTEDGTVYLWGSLRDSNGIMGLLESRKKCNAPVRVPMKEPVVKVASGDDHLVLLTHGGNLYTAGCAEKGQLGRVKDMFTDRGGRRGLDLLLIPQQVVIKGKVQFTDAFCGENSTFAVSKDGSVYVFGLSNHHQLGTTGTRYFPVKAACFGNSNAAWVEFSGGEEHSLCLDSEGKVYSLGSGHYGRLGLGEEAAQRGEPSHVPGMEPAKAVSCGSRVSFAVTRTGSVYAWGMGTNLQLGNGERNGEAKDEWSPVKMSGKQLENCTVLAASGGGQHTVLLVTTEREG